MEENVRGRNRGRKASSEAKQRVSGPRLIDTGSLFLLTAAQPAHCVVTAAMMAARIAGTSTTAAIAPETLGKDWLR